MNDWRRFWKRCERGGYSWPIHSLLHTSWNTDVICNLSSYEKLGKLMGWNNMKSFSIPGSEACQNDRVWHDQYWTDVHGNGAHSVFLCTRTNLLLQTPLYRNSKYNSLYSFTLLLSVELINWCFMHHFSISEFHYKAVSFSTVFVLIPKT